ncbi:MAG: hypothetical protein WCK53_12910, partial [Methanomicrobiales archaeon]
RGTTPGQRLFKFGSGQLRGVLPHREIGWKNQIFARINEMIPLGGVLHTLIKSRDHYTRGCTNGSYEYNPDEKIDKNPHESRWLRIKTMKI